MATKKVTITGVPPYDGTYDVPDGGWTNRELHLIKQISGVRAGELGDASKAGDTSVMVAIIAVILQRNGFPDVNVELLWDAQESNFDVSETGEPDPEDEQRPPDSEEPSGTPGGSERSSDGEDFDSERSEPGGGSSPSDGESNLPTPPPTGDPGSELSSASDPETSET